ncbi:hypothetical protein Y1Q_0001755 [Alligator mississippiensis]|uniref:Uncharacterized protein n=1 Tax=Alligator mississippiensis TaxID=8496 RepID=A0A151MKR9_ALLMI|nr:hypothetical protein Y1Q_0001755 [Alligator mississippiensis]
MADRNPGTEAAEGPSWDASVAHSSQGGCHSCSTVIRSLPLFCHPGLLRLSSSSGEALHYSFLLLKITTPKNLHCLQWATNITNHSPLPKGNQVFGQRILMLHAPKQSGRFHLI